MPVIRSRTAIPAWARRLATYRASASRTAVVGSGWTSADGDIVGDGEGSGLGGGSVGDGSAGDGRIAVGSAGAAWVSRTPETTSVPINAVAIAVAMGLPRARRPAGTARC